MAPTQFDSMPGQPAPVRQEADGLIARLRRRAGQDGGGVEACGKSALWRRRAAARRDPSQVAAATCPPRVCPMADGYMRRSPVQPLYVAVGYRRKIALRIIGTAAAAAAACAVGVYLLGRFHLLPW